MSELSRRDLLGLLAAASLTAACDRASREARRAEADSAASGRPYEPKFFTAGEWATVRLLVDYVIPADGRSGSATDAGVPAFMDFIMQDQPGSRTAMREGLAWLDAECRRRTGRDFAASSDAERRAVLDDIAWPARARPEHADGAQFFSGFRDLTASGFWSSRMGVRDLQYLGNTGMAEWNGCPEAALRKLGVSYES